VIANGSVIRAEERIQSLSRSKRCVHAVCRYRPTLVRLVARTAGPPVCAKALKEWSGKIDVAIRAVRLHDSGGVDEWQKTLQRRALLNAGSSFRAFHADHDKQEQRGKKEGRPKATFDCKSLHGSSKLLNSLLASVADQCNCLSGFVKSIGP